MAADLALTQPDGREGTYVIAHLYAAKAYLKESMSHAPSRDSAVGRIPH